MSLAQTKTVLRGERVLLDDGATKVLFFVHKAHGCDVVITERDLTLELGERGGHRYMRDVAPAIVSWFLDNAPDGYLPAGTLPYWGGVQGHWSYGPRSVWIEATDDCITVKIRDAGLREALDRTPLPLPPPMKLPPEYVAGTHPCPHCGEVPTSYRKLRDGGLVCLACGASSAG